MGVPVRTYLSRSIAYQERILTNFIFPIKSFLWGCIQVQVEQREVLLQRATSDFVFHSMRSMRHVYHLAYKESSNRLSLICLENLLIRYIIRESALKIFVRIHLVIWIALAIGRVSLARVAVKSKILLMSLIRELKLQLVELWLLSILSWLLATFICFLCSLFIRRLSTLAICENLQHLSIYCH